MATCGWDGGVQWGRKGGLGVLAATACQQALIKESPRTASIDPLLRFCRHDAKRQPGSSSPVLHRWMVVDG